MITAGLILTSGAVFFQGYAHFAFLAFVFLVSIYCIFNAHVITINQRYLIAVLSITLCIFVTMTLKSDFGRFYSYSNFALHIFIAAFIPLLFRFKDVATAYSNIIVFLAISSLVIYVCLVFYPGIAANFSKINGLTDFSYFNLFLYVVPETGFNGRNYSIFWEPGAFQAFLFLALLFECYIFSFKRHWQSVVLLIALLTTRSTTAYIMLAILGSYVSLMGKSFGVSRSLRASIMILGSICIFNPYFYDVIQSKFVEGNTSSGIRLVSTVSDLMIFSKSIIYGVGYSLYDSLIPIVSFDMFYLELGGTVNSFTYTLSVFGLLFFFPILYIYYLFAKRTTGKRLDSIIVFFLILIIFSTENFMTSLLWLSLGFYGLLHSIRRNPYRVTSYPVRDRV